MVSPNSFSDRFNKHLPWDFSSEEERDHMHIYYRLLLLPFVFFPQSSRSKELVAFLIWWRFLFTSYPLLHKGTPTNLAVIEGKGRLALEKNVTNMTCRDKIVFVYYFKNIIPMYFWLKWQIWPQNLTNTTEKLLFFFLYGSNRKDERKIFLGWKQQKKIFLKSGTKFWKVEIW